MSGLFLYPVALGSGMVLGTWLQNSREKRLNRRAQIVQAYAEAHKEDFPEIFGECKFSFCNIKGYLNGPASSYIAV